MNIEQVRALTQLTLDLELDETLSIEVPSKNQGLSLRTMFYRERKKLLEKGISLNVVIKLIKIEGKERYCAVFVREETPEVVICKADGTRKTVPLDTGIVPSSEEAIPDDVKDILSKYREGE
jgi:hypothetical protein